MIYTYNGAKVYYNFVNRGSSSVLVFLHGWGRDGKDFDDFASLFEDYSILTIDFPPFGKSEFEPSRWNIFSYATMFISLCAHLNISSIDIIGHSFGVRVALIVGVLNSSLVHSCIFTSGAGLKPKRSINYRLKVLRYKTARFLKLNAKGGSRDYQALSPEMKKLFKNIVNTHLDEYAKNIKSPTLIVWGKEDHETPLYMAKRFKKLIKNSKLIILNNGGHFAFLEYKLEFFSAVNKFLEENK